MKFTKQLLSERFQSEEQIGVYYANFETGERREEFKGSDDEYEESAHLPDGNRMSRCTNCAHWVVAHLSTGDVYGFLAEDNPVICEHINSAGGHDFALIGKRYIVDIWISLYSGADDQTVFDLKDPKDRDKVKAIYGDPSRWGYCDPITKNFIKPDHHDYPSNKRILAEPVATNAFSYSM
ncbi:hypothetical protein ACI2KR_31400 [Pseudomonas luteola]